MRNIYLLVLIFLVSSCQLKESPFFMDKEELDSIVVSMDPSADEPEFKMNSFTESPEIAEGHSCYFSLTKNAFVNEQYIYAGNLKSMNSFMQFNGEWIEFSGDSPMVKDSLSIYAKNDSLRLEIKAFKDSTSYESIQYRGEIKIFKNDENQFISSVYGECGC